MGKPSAWQMLIKFAKSNKSEHRMVPILDRPRDRAILADLEVHE